MNRPTDTAAGLAEPSQRDSYRNYGGDPESADPTTARVREFYRHNHQHQTFDFVAAKKAQWLQFNRREMSPWAALDYLNTLVDESDPDTLLPQISHLLQTAEAIRADGHPDWFVLTGFIHDLGKVLCLFGEPQWAVVGDTYPVGCRHSERIVYPEFFVLNADTRDSRYNTEYGIYEPHCGLGAVHMSWGHDEYLYHLLEAHLPEPALYMIRYHSFYAWHREGQYRHITDARDEANLRWVQAFNPYDLYSKNPNPPVLAELKPYYEDLMAKYLPATLRF
ncbi:MAG: inositol oxygenase [Methylibium sp. NZG]|nr:MAG: inositol oxygenase [Methylibium sp. NZG]